MEIVQPLRTRHTDRLRYVDNENAGDAHNKKLTRLNDEVELLLLAAERDTINKLYRNGKLRGEPRRRIERELDMRDAHLAGLQDDE